MVDSFWSIWWIWLSAGIVLAILEVLLPGFIFLGFATGAIITGLILLIPGTVFSLNIMLLIFAISSLISWLVLRRIFASPDGQVKIFRDDING